MNEINFFDPLEGNDTLPLYCVCCLDYGFLPTILLHSLPVKVQRLIVNRLAHTNLPQFILATHKGGHWSLVQLHYISHNINDNNNNNNSQTIPSNSTPSLNESHMANCLDSLNQLKDVDSESPVCTNCVSSIEFNLDPYTTAYFSDSYVKFMLTTKTSDKNWHCPFCKASYSLISSDRVNILERHLRLHAEIRCCVDCVTILPNNTSSLNCESACIHDCDELVSSQIKDDYQQYQYANSNSTDLPHKTVNLPAPDDCNDQPENNDVFPTFHRDNSQIQLRKCDVPLNSIAKTSCTYFSAGNWRRICTKCKVGFKTPAHYQQHLKNVHRGKKFLCQDCGVFFSTKGNLTTHFNQIHNQNTSLPCPICEKYLSNRFNLDRHIRSVHSDYEMSSNSSLKVNSIPVSNTNEGAHLTNSITVENPNEPPRGYYLYLSDSDCQQSISTNSPTSYINSSGNTQSVLQLISPTVDSKSVSLVADISLTPCGPSNPDAQLGVGGKLWKQNINIVQSPKSTISKSFHLC
ncbi:unnamed protein product [Schistosoma curassoni]|uniref:Zinc finger protein n=1 Tax=Schistosoma curassoni TaxID=6186 RepID=A0A183JCT6_9TREM|nr:unnamed protein product [Schistosoma curassoni]VDO61865.1 unnamed protein product [Schistosoma curassoni]